MIGGLEEGMDVWLVWFPDLRQDSISPSAGLVYGAYHGNDWIIPADGARVNLSVETGSIGGPVPDDALVANRQISAVPEPATYAAIFGGLTLAGVLVARRRRATVV
ncbi:hypothetical protein OPIT5_20170 [Opitutaceae bacterium TAV5]|nr:hypothetical protein OPIT5_20170 [Opitutaceae bacterium TAV5]